MIFIIPAALGRVWNAKSAPAKDLVLLLHQADRSSGWIRRTCSECGVWQQGQRGSRRARSGVGAWSGSRWARGVPVGWADGWDPRPLESLRPDLWRAKAAGSGESQGEVVMEAPPTPPLEVAEANFLLEFSVILFDPPAAFGRGGDVLEGR